MAPWLTIFTEVWHIEQLIGSSKHLLFRTANLIATLSGRSYRVELSETPCTSDTPYHARLVATASARRSCCRRNFGSCALGRPPARIGLFARRALARFALRDRDHRPNRTDPPRAPAQGCCRHPPRPLRLSSGRSLASSCSADAPCGPSHLLATPTRAKPRFLTR